MSASLRMFRPVERGEGEKVFPGPVTFWGPRHRSKILKRVFHMASHLPQICIKSIFGRGEPRTPLEELTTFPQTPSRMVRGHPYSYFLPLDALLSARTEIVIRPRENGFPGPVVALDRPAHVRLAVERSRRSRASATRRQSSARYTVVKC